MKKVINRKEYDIKPYVSLRGADLRSASLCGADLRSADLWGANLQGADLYGANLRSASLRGASLRSANLWGADLRSADLYGANLQGADLQGANLWGANLWGANLWGADLRGANLQGADLRSANLRGADLRGADLYGADLYGADLYGANLRGAKLPAPTIVLLANWGKLSDELTAICMQIDAHNHPNGREAFDAWAAGGVCPYSDCGVQRCISFQENPKLWAWSDAVPSMYEVMTKILLEKTKQDEPQGQGDQAETVEVAR